MPIKILSLVLEWSFLGWWRKTRILGKNHTLSASLLTNILAIDLPKWYLNLGTKDHKPHYSVHEIYH